MFIKCIIIQLFGYLKSLKAKRKCQMTFVSSCRELILIVMIIRDDFLPSNKRILIVFFICSIPMPRELSTMIFSVIQILNVLEKKTQQLRMKKILNPGTIIDGAAMAKGLLQRLKNLISSRNVSIPAPKLAIILAGNNHASQAYVKRKIKAADYIGIQHEIIRFGEGQQSRLTSSIETLNKDSSFQGFIVQLPLPSGYNTQAILDKIDKNKDIDCLHRRSLELFEKYGQDAPIIPCTSQAIMHICDEYGIDLKGKKAMVVGKSLLVGQPAAIMLRKRGAEVKVFDRSSKNCLHEQATKSDIIVSATGHPRLIRRAHPKSIIFDVGFNREPGSSIIIGDVDIKQIKEFMLYTPVPGGIGPLTVAMLMNNAVRCWKKQYNLL